MLRANLEIMEDEALKHVWRMERREFINCGTSSKTRGSRNSEIWSHYSLTATSISPFWPRANLETLKNTALECFSTLERGKFMISRTSSDFGFLATFPIQDGWNLESARHTLDERSPRCQTRLLRSGRTWRLRGTKVWNAFDGWNGENLSTGGRVAKTKISRVDPACLFILEITHAPRFLDCACAQVFDGSWK